MTIVSTRKSWFSRSRSCCARGGRASRLVESRGAAPISSSARSSGVRARRPVRVGRPFGSPAPLLLDRILVDASPAPSSPPRRRGRPPGAADPRRPPAPSSARARTLRAGPRHRPDSRAHGARAPRTAGVAPTDPSGGPLPPCPASRARIHLDGDGAEVPLGQRVIAERGGRDSRTRERVVLRRRQAERALELVQRAPLVTRLREQLPGLDAGRGSSGRSALNASSSERLRLASPWASRKRTSSTRTGVGSSAARWSAGVKGVVVIPDGLRDVGVPGREPGELHVDVGCVRGGLPEREQHLTGRRRLALGRQRTGQGEAIPRSARLRTMARWKESMAS